MSRHTCEYSHKQVSRGVDWEGQDYRWSSSNVEDTSHRSRHVLLRRVQSQEDAPAPLGPAWRVWTKKILDGDRVSSWPKSSDGMGPLA